MDKQPITAVEIYTEYVRLRQGGWSQEAAVQHLQPKADQLSKLERKQLGQIIVTWEGREGTHFKPGIRPTLQTPPAVGSLNSESLPAQPSGKPVIRRITTPTQNTDAPAFVPALSEITATDGIRCSNCGKYNSKHESYCYACGQIVDLSRSGTK